MSVWYMSVWYMSVWYMSVWYVAVWYLSVWYMSVWYMSVWYVSVWYFACLVLLFPPLITPRPHLPLFFSRNPPPLQPTSASSPFPRRALRHDMACAGQQSDYAPILYTTSPQHLIGQDMLWGEFGLSAVR
ncbi:unnamed protein product [Closterium sp. NIES-54]